MTVTDIKNLVISAAPDAKHYYADIGKDPFTIWAETRRLPDAADDRHDMGWAFQIVHYAKLENDSTAEAIEDALIAHPGVTYAYNVGYDRKTGFVRHVFDCEGI